MGTQYRLTGVALALTALLAQAASAQDSPDDKKVILPPIDVSSSRLGAGIVGASTTIITAEDIEKSPGHSIYDVLSREPGIQTFSFYGGVNGAGSALDMRGFGATASSNTLILINGRRLNDWDSIGFDLSTIPRASIERIEITRGNSGAVLYGDGVVGGVVNIVTKTNAGLPNSARFESGFGSFAQREGTVSANASVGAFSTSVYGNVISSDGYRVNNELRQKSGTGDLRYATSEGSAYVTMSGEDQRLQLPGGRFITPFVNEYATDRTGTTTPFDFANRKNFSVTGGVTRQFAPGAELILDGGFRQKHQQGGNFSSFNPIFDSSLDTVLTTASFTPRTNIQYGLFGLPSRMTAGLDLYYTRYASKRSVHLSDPPNHRYDLNQSTLAGYWQQTTALRPDTDVSFGYRVQQNSLNARDRLDLTAPGGLGAAPQGLPLSRTEVQQAAHLGLEHRFGDTVAIFGRVAKSFRVPNVDERIGSTPFVFPLIPTNFDLRMQRSWDVEGGARLRFGPIQVQSSIYDMYLTDELHNNPITLANVNLDPTRRYGNETRATIDATDSLRFLLGAAYTRSVYRSGPFAGNDVPVVSRWTGSGGVSWDIYKKWLTFDGIVRYASHRRLDSDDTNSEPLLIPSHTTVDMRLGGEIERFRWSVAVQNVFNVQYFDYGTVIFPGSYLVYPLPGRVFLAKGSATF